MAHGNTNVEGFVYTGITAFEGNPQKYDDKFTHIFMKILESDTSKNKSGFLSFNNINSPSMFRYFIIKAPDGGKSGGANILELSPEGILHTTTVPGAPGQKGELLFLKTDKYLQMTVYNRIGKDGQNGEIGHGIHNPPKNGEKSKDTIIQVDYVYNNFKRIIIKGGAGGQYGKEPPLQIITYRNIGQKLSNFLYEKFNELYDLDNIKESFIIAIV